MSRLWAPFQSYWEPMQMALTREANWEANGLPAALS